MKLYVIKSCNCDKVYIGSTSKDIHRRLAEHNVFYRKWLRTGGLSCYYSSFEILKHGGATIHLLEECDRDIVRDREKDLIKDFENSVNLRGRKRSRPRISEDEFLERLIDDNDALLEENKYLKSLLNLNADFTSQDNSTE